MSTALVAIGGALTGTSAAITAGTASAATIASAASVGATVVGSTISAAASAWSAARAKREEEEAQKRFERRQERSHEGVAEAAEFWNDPTADRLGDPNDPRLGIIGEVQRQGQVGRPNERIGRRSDQVGSRSIRKIKAQSGTEPKMPKYAYDTNSRMIQINS